IQNALLVGLGLGRRRTTQERFDSQLELNRIERLREVIVGARSEALSLVLDRRLLGQHQDRCTHSVASHELTELEPIYTRHHHVEDHAIHFLGERYTQSLYSVGRLG